MSKNLKVDAKTNILEFKRKHNGLVESSSIKEETTNIESLSDENINSLKVGDVVVKKTGNQGHAYIVTYKEENHGICLSYFDGSGYLETISYDYTDGHWIFNSKDVCQVPSDNNIENIVENLVEGGTLDNAKPIYWHSITLTRQKPAEPDRLLFYLDLIILNNSPTPFTLDTFKEFINNNPTMEIKCVQGYTSDLATNMVSYIKYDNTNTIKIYTVNVNTGEIQASDRFTLTGTLTDNGVNKIN